MAFQDNHSIALKRHDLLSDRIYKVYSLYTPCIYHAYTMRRSLAIPLGCPSALGSLRPGLPSELFSFGHREVAPTRGWGCPKFHNQVLISLTWLNLNVLVGTVVAARRSTYGTQRTVPNEIWSLQHLGVTVNHSWNDVLPVHPKNH